jgi:hypothetical protein
MTWGLTSSLLVYFIVRQYYSKDNKAGTEPSRHPLNPSHGKSLPELAPRAENLSISRCPSRESRSDVNICYHFANYFEKIHAYTMQRSATPDGNEQIWSCLQTTVAKAHSVTLAPVAQIFPYLTHRRCKGCIFLLSAARVVVAEITSGCGYLTGGIRCETAMLPHIIPSYSRSCGQIVSSSRD